MQRFYTLPSHQSIVVMYVLCNLIQIDILTALYSYCNLRAASSAMIQSFVSQVTLDYISFLTNNSTCVLGVRFVEHTRKTEMLSVYNIRVKQNSPSNVNAGNGGWQTFVKSPGNTVLPDVGLPYATEYGKIYRAHCSNTYTHHRWFCRQLAVPCMLFSIAE